MHTQPDVHGGVFQPPLFRVFGLWQGSPLLPPLSHSPRRKRQLEIRGPLLSLSVSTRDLGYSSGGVAFEGSSVRVFEFSETGF